jgi:DegV family protein with EDD domain
MKAYEHLLSNGYDYVVSVHLSSILSGAINTARTGAQKFNGRVHHVDSQQLSMGIGYQVLAGAEAARQGATLDEVLEEIARTRTHVQVYAMLNTLEYVRRSGRLSWAEANVGEILQLKPFLTLRDGAPCRHGEARTRKKGLQRLYKILANLGPLERLAILHTNPDEDAREMATKFAGQTRQPPIVVQATPIIGTHLGPNGIGFAAVVR